MKAQVAVEYLAIVGIVLTIISFLAVYIWQQNEVSTRINQAQIAVSTIAGAADNIYAQGPGAKSNINVFFPNGYESSESYIENKTILLKIYTPAGADDVLAITRANINGTLPETSGYKLITLELVGGNVSISSS